MRPKKTRRAIHKTSLVAIACVSGALSAVPSVTAQSGHRVSLTLSRAYWWHYSMYALDYDAKIEVFYVWTVRCTLFLQTLRDETV